MPKLDLIVVWLLVKVDLDFEPQQAGGGGGESTTDTVTRHASEQGKLVPSEVLNVAKQSRGLREQNCHVQ